MSGLRYGVPVLSGNPADDQYGLGAGTGAKINASGGAGVSGITSSATPAVDTDTNAQLNITALSTAITSMSTNLTGTPTDGQTLTIRIKDNGTTRAITWGSKFASSGAATLLANTSAGKTHTLNFRYDAVKAAWVCLFVDSTGY